MLPATYYDGQSAARFAVTVSAHQGGLRIRKEDGTEVLWQKGSFRQVGGAYGEPARLERGDEALVADRALLSLLGRPPRSLRRLALSSGVALLLGGGLGYVYGLPALARAVALRLPPSWDASLGDSALRQIAPEKKRCDDRAAIAAVEEIVARLRQGSPGTAPIQVTLIKDPLVNAFAVPGGHVVLYGGLLGRTKRPEELAGVLGHEVQHVVQRHPTTALVRSLALNALLSLMIGDMSSVLTAAATLGEMRYQRGDEASADREGMRMVLAARIDPQGTVDVFRTLEKTAIDLPGVMRYLSSHPLTAERIAALSAMKAAAAVPPEPLLPGKDWAAVIKPCTE